MPYVILTHVFYETRCYTTVPPAMPVPYTVPLPRLAMATLLIVGIIQYRFNFFMSIVKEKYRCCHLPLRDCL